MRRRRLLQLNYLFCFFALLFVLLFLMQYQLWFGSDNLPGSFALKEKIENQLLLNKKKLEENNSLYTRIQAYKHGSAGVEGQARYDLGMIKKGEDYFQFKKG